MRFLSNVLAKTEEYKTLERAVEHGRTPAMATGLSSVHKAHLIHSMCTRLGRRALVLASDEAEAAKLCSDICAMGTRAVYYPARDMTFREVTGVSGEFVHQRIAALFEYTHGECDVVIACADAALQYTVPPAVLEKNTAVIKPGAAMSIAL